MATVVKVGLDPKQTQTSSQVLNLTTGVLTETLTQYWLIEWDSRQEDPTANYGATDGTHVVPVAGDNYLGASILWCTSAVPQLKPDSAGKVYRYTATYTNGGSASKSGKWDVQVAFDGVPYTVPAYYDVNGNAIVNSANQKFQSQPNQTFYDSSVDLSFKTTSFDETDCESLRGQLNSEAITLTISALSYSRTFPIGTLRLDNYKATPVVAQGAIAYWNVNINFTYRAQVTAPTNSGLSGTVSGFILFIVDQGFCTLDGSGNPVVIRESKTSQALNEPHFLDGSGNLSSEAYYLNFMLNNSGDFTPLIAGIS
jgi:hypothetical protein